MLVFWNHRLLRSRKIIISSTVCHLRTLICDVYSNPTEFSSNATVKGWVKAIRKMKQKVFLDIDDGSYYKRLQVVLPKDSLTEKLTYGASVEVEGEVIVNNNQPEVRANNITIIGECDLEDGYPFLPRTTYPPEYVREYLHFRPRTLTFGALLRLRSKILREVNEFFTRNDFISVHPPVLTSNDCEGAGEVFHVIKSDDPEGSIAADGEFFDRTTYLSVSGQLHLESMARALGNVYSFGPTFRAENSKSRHHLAEFYMIEAEMAFLSTMMELTQFMEHFIRSLISTIITNNRDEIKAYQELLKIEDNISKLEYIAGSSFPVISYDEAYGLLRDSEHKFTHALRERQPLTREHELFLIEHHDRLPVFVVDWPREIKPFYMKSLQDRPDYVLSVDLLFPGVGEICGGGVREDNYEKLKNSLRENCILDKLDWYLQLRKFGNVPTGGFGMGFERFIQVLLGTRSIKDTIPFPRWPHNCRT